MIKELSAYYKALEAEIKETSNLNEKAFLIRERDILETVLGAYEKGKNVIRSSIGNYRS